MLKADIGDGIIKGRHNMNSNLPRQAGLIVPLTLSLCLFLLAHPVFSQAGNPGTRTKELFKLGEDDLAIRADERLAHINHLQQSLGLAREEKDYRLISRCLWKLSRIYLDSGESKKALEGALQALANAQEAHDVSLEAWASDQVGNAYFGLEKYKEALDSFRKAAQLMRQCGDRSGEAMAFRDVGVTYKRLSLFDESLESLHTALDIFKETNGKAEMGSVLENMGAAYANLGDSRRALKYYQQALQIAREGDENSVLILGCFYRLGRLYLDLDNPARALDCLKQALEFTEKYDMKPMQAEVLYVMINCYVALGRMDSAIRIGHQFLALDRDRWQQAQALLKLGKLYRDSDPSLAGIFIRKAIAIFDRYRGPSTWQDYADVAEACAYEGDLDRATKYYQISIDHFESIRDHLGSNQQKGTFLGKHEFIYQGMIKTLLQRDEQHPQGDDAAHAFLFYERGKARAMLEGIAEAHQDTESVLDPSLSLREKQLPAAIARLQTILLQKDLTLEKRREFLDQLNQAEQDLDQLIEAIRRHNPHYAAFQYPKPLSLKQAQNLLDQRTALLAYLSAGDQLYCFVLTHDEFFVSRLAVSSRLESERIRNYVDLLASDNRAPFLHSADAGWKEISRRLYQDLLEPVRKRLPMGTRRLIIIPDGLLHFLPFETLICAGESAVGSGHAVAASSSRPHYLLEDFVISYAPSASVLAELRKVSPTQGPEKRNDLLLVSNPAPRATLKNTGLQNAAELTAASYDEEGQEINRIPFSSFEAEAISRYLSPGSIVLTGAEASEHRVKTDRLDRFRVIHFATHGLISQRIPARSALLLASSSEDGEDGLLQAREISHLKLSSDLVVLSACQTARGTILAGEGVQGLAQAFLRAGAQSVIGSLWNVNDKQTARFMAEFYQHLAAGQPKAEALRAAKLDMLQRGSDAAPCFWAPFILIGEADQPVAINGPSLWARSRNGLFYALLMALIIPPTFILSKKGRSRFVEKTHRSGS